MPTCDRRFIVSQRTFDWDAGSAEFYYELAGDKFIERVQFDFDLKQDANERHLGAALDLAHVVLGTSYYKLHAPGEVHVERGLTPAQLAVAEATYDLGLREFAAVNGLPLPHHVIIDAQTRKAVNRRKRTGERAPLLPIGGGKDSALVLAAVPEGRALTINPTEAHRRVAAAGGTPLLGVRRVLDPLLAARTREGGLNGHVPVTAINSAIATLVAVLADCGPVIFANERSADEETVLKQGVPVNHQYSKSFHFEQLFSTASRELEVEYFSLTRQLSEIATVSAVASLPAMRNSILSCNRAYKGSIIGELDCARQQWCLECAKCCFTFLSFAVFLTPRQTGAMFGGNPLHDVAMVPGFRALWDVEKPYDCVGERAESAAAMAYLFGTSAWGNFAVVRALGNEAQLVAAKSGVDVNTLISPRGPHIIPNNYTARLEPLLRNSLSPVR